MLSFNKLRSGRHGNIAISIRRLLPRLLVVADTGSVAFTNVVLLAFAGRSLPARDFSELALVQLVVMTAVMVQRGFVLAPGLSVQRQRGRGTFSLSVLVRSSAPLSATVCLTAFWLTGGLSWVPAILVSSFGLLAMDVVRHIMLTRSGRHLMLLGTAAWGLATIAGIAFGPANSRYYVYVWGLAAIASALYCSVVFIERNRSVRVLAIAEIWSLGKWSGLDALLSASANLIPLLTASAVASEELVGAYRLLQSALGPLNIVTASLTMIVSAESWRLSSLAGLDDLRRRVRRLTIFLFLCSMMYIGLAEAAMLMLSGLRSSDVFRIATVVAAAGLLGALTSGYSAAALALGGQRHGALIRLSTLLVAVVVSVWATIGFYIPWSDPVAPVTLFAAGIGLFGWVASYRTRFSHAVAECSSADTLECNRR